MNMKKLVWFPIFILIFLTGCHKTSNSTQLQQKGKEQTTLLQLLQTIEGAESLGDDFVIAKEYIEKTEEFVTAYPEDPMAAEFLYKAALMAMTIAKASEHHHETILYSQKALLLFDDIQRIYPEFSGLSNCIINKGIIYEDILQDYVNAEIYYREFIARYPADTLAINLALYLPHLGKSPEEIMSEFGK